MTRTVAVIESKPLARMSTSIGAGLVLLICFAFVSPAVGQAEPVPLPTPGMDGDYAVERALAARRSVRRFTADPLTLHEVGQLLWAAQGVTDSAGHRTAPSAGALYPLQVYVLAKDVTGVAPGFYRYKSKDHALEPHAGTIEAEALTEAAFGQSWIADAPALLVVAARFAVTAAKYGPRAPGYARIEAGHASENAALQAVALGLGSTMVGGFREDAVRQLFDIAEDETPLLLIPVGRPEP